MKRDLKTIVYLLEQKIENAENDLLHERNRIYPSNKKMIRLEGEIQAYQDILILINTSGLLDV